MNKSDILKMETIGYYREGFYYDIYNELFIKAIYKDDSGNYRIAYTEYTGCGFKAYNKKVYNVYGNEPYFLHDEHRIRVSDCSKVKIDENNRFLIYGEGLNIFRY